MRILYGVVGEGMGHAIRSRVVLSHLVDEGHEVEIMASSRAVDFLSRYFENVHRIHGFHIITRHNRVRRGKTFWSNVLAGNEGAPEQIEAYFDLIDGFDPQVVVSDFESWTYLYGKMHGLPVFSVDNMQIINRCSHPDEIVEGEEIDYRIAKTFVKGKLPFCDHYLITTFFFPEVRKERTSLHPPILRPEILEAEPSLGDHLLVYQTAEGHSQLEQVLARSGVPCRIYGMRRDIEQDQTDGDLTHRPFSETGFVEDLASARAAIIGGGFTAMGECVYLHKPVLSVPLDGQFEQVMNGRYLERVGYGRWAQQIDGDVLGSFLDGIEGYQRKLEAYHQDGNRSVLRALDEQLDRAAADLV